MADDLRIYRRQAPAAPPPAPDVDSDSEDEGDELDGPDTPSPTETTFPPAISTSAPASAPASTQTSTVDLGNIGTETLVTSSTTTTTPASTTNGAALSATSPTFEPQRSQAQQTDLSESTEQSGLMSRGGVIAMGMLSKNPLSGYQSIGTLCTNPSSWLGDLSYYCIRDMEMSPPSEPV